MKLKHFWPVAGFLLACLTWTTPVTACDVIEDGCLGCRDHELPTCLDNFVAEICAEASDGYFCDKTRAWDDAEKLVIMNTGRHMSDVRAMMRNPRKYHLRHPPHP